MAMKSAFCSVSLQTGTLIVGWTTLVFVIYRALDTTFRILSPPPSSSPVFLDVDNNFTSLSNFTLISNLNSISNLTSIKNLTDVLDALMTENVQETEIDEGHKDGSYYGFYAYTILHIIVLISLLYGAYKSRPRFLVPYLIDYSVYIVLLTFVTVHSLVRGDHVTHLAFKIIGIPVGVYYLCIVGSFFLELRSAIQISTGRA